MSTVVTTVLLQWNAQLQNLQTLMFIFVVVAPNGQTIAPKESLHVCTYIIIFTLCTVYTDW